MASLHIDQGLNGGYAQLSAHLRAAHAAASRLDDRAAVALIEVLQRLCVAHGAEAPPAPVATSNVSSLNIYTFGSFRSFLNGRALNGWRKKSESLFKFLVCQRGTPVHRDQLLDLFWAEASPQAARNCLNVTLHALRRSMEPLDGSLPAGGLIQLADDCYRLSDEVEFWCDADAFMQHLGRAQAASEAADPDRAIAHLELADALYQGDFLQEDRYEEWTIGRRERLRTAYLALLGQLAQLYSDTGKPMRAIDCAQKILERDNCHEQAHRQIMRAYHSLGQRALGLRQYAVCRETLDRELGVQPMDETSRLAELIRNGQAV